FSMRNSTASGTVGLAIERCLAIVTSNTLEKLIPVHAGHEELGEDEIVGRRLEMLRGFDNRVLDVNGVTVRSKRVLYDGYAGYVVGDYKNPADRFTLRAPEDIRWRLRRYTPHDKEGRPNPADTHRGCAALFQQRLPH
ncbi:MAG: hypothetical protein ACOCYC_01790, partial [bacterium]